MPSEIYEEAYWSNLRLNRAEYALRHTYLRSMPRYLSIVVGNKCNIDCPYCYQSKNGDSLLDHAEISAGLRRELQAFYPYLSTLRVQGGEAFMIKGFKDLIADASANTDRPILSLSTNGTLINDSWAELITETPFQSLTFSIDGAEPETYERLRRGAKLEQVLENVRRLQERKMRTGSAFPKLDFFFLIIRSTFREIPRFLEIAHELGIPKVSFQTALIDQRNLSREPELAKERLEDPSEIRELHSLVSESLIRWARHFERINLSGLHGLFQSHQLDTSFLEEDSKSLYPGNEGVTLAPEEIAGELLEKPRSGTHGDSTDEEIELCPNPWTLLYITESGNVHTCFMARAMGNLFERPLLEIWNSPEAVSARRQMLSSRFTEAGCSSEWCAWRDGKTSPSLTPGTSRQMIQKFRLWTEEALQWRPAKETVEVGESGSGIAAVRRRLAAHGQRIRELELNLVDLCQKNQAMLIEAERRAPSPTEDASDFELHRLSELIKAGRPSTRLPRRFCLRLGVNVAFRLGQLRKGIIRWLGRKVGAEKESS